MSSEGHLTTTLTTAKPDFRAALATSGTTLLRMPGGSWSNSYDWLGCERSSDEERGSN